MKRIVFILATIILFVGCVTTKDKGFKSDTKVSTKDSLVSAITDSIKKVYEEKYREVGFYIDFYNNNANEQDSAIQQMQDAIWDGATTSDSLRKMIRDFKCPESTIKYNVDGSVEVKGKIKSLSSKVLELQKSLDSARVKTEKKADVKIQEIVKTVTVTKYKKSAPLWWLYLVVLVIGYILGGKFPLPKIFPAVKKIIPWI